MFFAATGLATHIYNNQLKSILLLAGFPFLLLLMIGGFFGALNALSGGVLVRQAGAAASFAEGMIRAAAPSPEAVTNIQRWHFFTDGFSFGAVNYGHVALIAASIWFVIAFFFHSKMMQMATGSQPISRQQMPKIYNMLENLCISRGITMPQFEVIDSPALNAFATGISDKTYKIVLTRGIIERLSDDELEAVIAHELSHILNRDVRLLIIAVIFVGMISFFAEMVYRILVHGMRPHYYRRSNSRDDKGGTAAILLIALVILVIGYIFAIAIRFALSRKREYLADAGAVELTKNPEAMIRALQRISGNDRVAGMPDDVEQMCIENSHSFFGVFATHPKIEDRIRALSEMTGTPIPQVQVSLRRGPRRPWDGNPTFT